MGGVSTTVGFLDWLVRHLKSNKVQLRRRGGRPSQNLQTRCASGSGRPGEERIFAAARVLGREAGDEPMSRAKAEGVSAVGAALRGTTRGGRNSDTPALAASTRASDNTILI